MKKIIDKLPIIICCCLIIGEEVGFYSYTIISFLAAVSVTSICQYVEKGRISFLAELFYLIVCIFVNELVFFIPLLIYDITFERRYGILCAASGVFVYFLFCGFFENILFMAVTIAVSVILAVRSLSLEEIEKRYFASRDSSVEQNILLTNKNRNLSERQDYEVHLATLKERNRIAREIHDNVGHLLSRSILQVGALKITARDELQKEGLSSLCDTLNNAMNSIRQSVHDIHDESVELESSVYETVNILKEKKINVKLEYDLSDNIPSKIKFCFISILKEAVANIIKHSSATHVILIFREHPAFYQLMIEDNGKCPEKITSSGIGLANMRERVEDLGGIFTVKSGDNGFTIFISIKK